MKESTLLNSLILCKQGSNNKLGHDILESMYLCIFYL